VGRWGIREAKGCGVGVYNATFATEHLQEEIPKDTHPDLLGITISSAQLLQPGFFLLPQIRKLLDLGLVEAIDDRVLPLLNVYALDLACHQNTLI
jgi:hypothetical protein